MQRRDFMAAFAAALPLAAMAQQKNSGNAFGEALREIERAAGGRLGVAVLDTADGSLRGQRLDERFPMCSTFKWLAAAHVLQRVDGGKEDLQRRIRFDREALVAYSPVCEQHAGGEGMTLAQLCEAAITLSDNTAANLILASYGGPATVTRFARSLGDTATRLDRMEPVLNESRPGDPRDTTSPRGMSTALRAALLGDALSPAGRDQLARWMEATKTNGTRLRADLPEGWRMGSKTGTGARGSTNDVGIFWPPGGRAPVIVAAYLTQTTAPEATRLGAIAAVARLVTRGA